MVTSINSEIGKGIYTVPDLAEILHLKYYKVKRLLDEYWNKRLTGKNIKSYSWSDGKAKAVGFNTLIEFYIFYQLKNAGISTKDILISREELANMFNTPFPFANLRILKGLKTAGKRIVFAVDNEKIIDINMTGQLNLGFIKEFMKKLEFDENDLAQRFWPLGKQRFIVIDPDHQFGQPTIRKTNILASTIYRMAEANEPKSFIADTYSISLKAVEDAIEYCKEAA